MIQARTRNRRTGGAAIYYKNNNNPIKFLQIGSVGYYVDISVNLDIKGRAILYKEDKKITTKYYDYDAKSWKDTVVTLPCYTLLSDGILRNVYTTGVDGISGTPNGYEVPYSYNSVKVGGNEVISVSEYE